jgi:hypothetical protein
VSGYGRITLFGALLAAGTGIAVVHAQTVLGDPRDAAKTFASNCSACHKSPRGLAKSGQIAGFLRQHYTTGPEMSAAMAAYLVSAGAAPPEKKGAAIADGTAAAKKGKKQEQLSAAHPSADAASDATQQRTLRSKQRPAKSDEEAPAAPASAATQPAAEDTRPAAASAALAAAQPSPAAPSEPAPMVLDIPLPPLPEGPPADLAQSAFSSSPLP